MKNILQISVLYIVCTNQKLQLKTQGIRIDLE